MNFENMFNIFFFSEREEEYLGKDREIKLEIVLTMTSVDWWVITLNTMVPRIRLTKFKGVKGLKDELDDDEINAKDIEL